MKPVKKKTLLSTAVFGLLLALLLLISILYAYNIYTWGDYPDFGLSFRGATGIKVVWTLTEPGRQAGLRVGDHIISVNGKSYQTFGELRSIVHRKPGDQNVYLVERSGKQVPITITNGRIGFIGAINKSGYLLVLGICYMLIGALVYLMKPHQRTSWIFLLFTATTGLWMTFLFKVTLMTPNWLEAFQLFIYMLVPAVFIHLTISFPVERRMLTQYPVSQLFPYIFSILLFLGISIKTYQIFDASKPLFIIWVIYLAISVLLFLGSFVQLWITSKSELVKSRSKLILLGAAISALIPLIDFISSVFFKLYLLPNFNFYLPFLIFFPMAIAYSIIKHDLFDIDAIIKRTYGYVLTTGALAGIYGIFVLVSNLAFGGYEFAKSPVFPIIFILAVIFLFNPVRNRVQRFIDRVFYRLEYDYQETVGKISETMRSLLNLDEIGKSLMKFALQPLFVDAGAVMLLNPVKSDYVCLVQEGQREDRKIEAWGETEFEEVGLQEKEGQLTANATAVEPEVSCLTLPVDDPLMQKIAERKKEVTIYDIQEDPAFESDREACKKTFDRLGATLLVPLIYEEHLTGVISLGQKKSGKFYRPDDINLLKILANQGAVAIENALMVEDVIEKERMEEELSIARDLQLSMLPAECPPLEGFDIAAYSMPAREVGGDFYDFIDIGENKDGLLIGDVTGKSVSGALVMSSSRSIFRMLSEETLSVGEIMVRANRRIKKDVKSGMFVALLYAVVNAKDKTICFCSAGQTLPIYRSSKTGAASLMDTQGDNFPLGILEDVDYQESILKLESGDKVVFYTDGIVEAMNEKHEIFGFDRLLEVVQKNGDVTSEALLKNILHQVDAFSGGAVQHDDLTIIVLGSL